MKAVQYTAIGSRPELREVEKPTPGLGEVLLKITASGLCHSDEVVMSYPEGVYPYPLPMTFGHEPAGVVADLGGLPTSDFAALVADLATRYPVETLEAPAEARRVADQDDLRVLEALTRSD